MKAQKTNENVQTKNDVEEFNYGMTNNEVIRSNEIDVKLLEEANKLFDKTSPKIRWLRFEKNVSRTLVSKMLRIRYQHVRNVELMPLKRDVS